MKNDADLLLSRISHALADDPWITLPALCRQLGISRKHLQILIESRLGIGFRNTRSDSVIKAISRKLLHASIDPEFQELRQQLSDLSQLLDAGDVGFISSAKATLQSMGDTPLQRSFFDAIAFDLDYCENLD